MQQLHVRGRFAPSPSGEMHLGNAWTALLAWLAVRSNNGTMILRIEDLDPERSRAEYAMQLLFDLRWLGLDWDEGPDCGGAYGPYEQEQRRTLYQQALEQLAQKGLIYPCYCSRAQLNSPTLAPHLGEQERCYPGTCRNLVEAPPNRRPALRLWVPDCQITVTDQVYGQLSQNLKTSCGDFIVQRADGIHAYQLAVVVDDGLMGVTQVVRGADLLESTPRQLYLYQQLQLQPPDFAHVPLLCTPSRQRLSKREQSLTVAALRQQGVQPRQIIGYLAWRAGLIKDYRPCAPQELVKGFSLAKLSQQPIIIDPNFKELLLDSSTNSAH